MKNPLLLFILLFAIATSAVAQSKRKPAGFNNRGKEQDKFLEKQWWLGLKAGVNLTQASPITRYSVLTPTNYSPALTDKKYDGFKRLGTQATFEVTFYYRGISFSVQPTYRHSTFTYSNQFIWNDSESPTNNLLLTYKHEQKVDYADLPLIVKYDITGNKLRPYVQGGIFYSLLIGANTSVKVSGTDNASGGTNDFSNPPVIVGAKDLFHKGYWGLIAGAGLNYNLGNVRFIFDASYRIGMSNITNTKNRFSNDRLSGIADAMDDVKINNIVISVGCLFPMRFLSTNFKALDR